MQLGGLAHAEQRLELLPQSAHQREQARRQHIAMMHVDDGMAFGGMKADMQTLRQALDLEGGAAARARRHDHRLFDMRLDTRPFQRGNDSLALLGAIGVRRQILQRTAAAGPKVETDWIQARRPAAR